MDFMNAIFLKKEDAATHAQFVRFGKGNYDPRALLNFARSKQIKVSGSFEYARDFVLLASHLADSFKVSGIVMSKENISGLGTGGAKRGGAYYEFSVNKEMSASELRTIAEQSYAPLLDLEGKGISFKCKKKLPKPGKGEGKVDDKFCVLVGEESAWKTIRPEFFPFVPENAKRVKVKYSVQVQEIVAPEGEKDFEKVRLLAQRKGKIIRFAEIDKKEERAEIEFCV